MPFKSGRNEKWYWTIGMEAGNKCTLIHSFIHPLEFDLIDKAGAESRADQNWNILFCSKCKIPCNIFRKKFNKCWDQSKDRLFYIIYCKVTNVHDKLTNIKEGMFVLESFSLIYKPINDKNTLHTLFVEISQSLSHLFGKYVT